MKLDKLATVLRTCRKSYGLDMTDLLILDEIAGAHKRKEEVTIMKIVDSSSAASRATVHERIKRLCNEKYLRKDAHPGNLSLRVLALGPTYHQLVEELGRT